MSTPTFEKLIENATDALNQVRPMLTQESQQRRNEILVAEAEVWAKLALAVATRGG